MGKYFCNGDQKYGLLILSICTYRKFELIRTYIDNVGHNYYACNVIHLKLKINSSHAGILHIKSLRVNRCQSKKKTLSFSAGPQVCHTSHQMVNVQSPVPNVMPGVNVYQGPYVHNQPAQNPAHSAPNINVNAAPQPPYHPAPVTSAPAPAPPQPYQIASSSAATQSSPPPAPSQVKAENQACAPPLPKRNVNRKPPSRGWTSRLKRIVMAENNSPYEKPEANNSPPVDASSPYGNTYNLSSPTEDTDTSTNSPADYTDFNSPLGETAVGFGMQVSSVEPSAPEMV